MSFVQVPPDSTGKKIATVENGSGEQVQVIAIDSTTTKTIGEQITSSDVGLVTNTVIHGKTTAGGGDYVDVKVNPSGALVADVSDSVVGLDAATLAALETPTSSATVSSVSVSTSNATILSANASRLGAAIYNNATTDLLVKFGATASSSSFTVILLPKAYYEVPFKYVGIIDAVLASGTGNALVTEFS